MAIITYQTTPERGTPANVTLSKTELALVASVAGDTYFSDSTNWKSVSCLFVSSNSNQKTQINFDATEVTPSASFSVSAKSRGNFLIQNLIIRDFDGDIFIVPRDQLTTAEFDVTF